MSKITASIQTKVAAIRDELNDIVLERHDVIDGLIVGRIAQEHVVLLGPGGTGKSFVCNQFQSRIIGAQIFSTALDETTDPSRVFGPVDIMALKNQGKSRVVTTGMLPEATDAFVDEIMNANGPVKHSLQPILNERIFHNNGVPHDVPLRQMIAGTNVNNADTDPSLAPFFDRLHLRYTVDYLSARDAQANMVAQAIARMATVGRGTAAGQSASGTTVTIDELDQAHNEALDLDVDNVVMNMFLDIREELRSKGIMFSDRRMVEGMGAVLANAWLRNHETVQVGDLDILAAMWWSLQEHAPEARGIILGATNPSEKAALDLLDELDKVKADLGAFDRTDIDEDRKRRLGVEAVKNADRLIRDAKEHREKAVAGGAGTQRIDEVIGKANTFKIEVGKAVFKIDPASMTAMTAAAH